MAKIVDITEKLNFDENPALLVKGKKLEVNADAPTILKVMGILNIADPGPEEVIQVYDIIFSEKAKKEIEKLKVNFQDLMVIVENAVSLIVGETTESGEQ